MVEFSNPTGYDRWMGRWSARLAPALVDFADLPTGGRFLDVGSGTGELAIALLASVVDARVIGIEPAESYVAYSRARFRDSRVRFEQGDAQDLPFADGQFDGSLSHLVLQELTDAPKAVSEMRRVTRVGGRVAASQWDFEKGLPMLALFWESVIEAIGTDDARREASSCMDVSYPDDEALQRLWSAAGLVDIRTEIKEIEMNFDSFHDYWEPFLSGVTQTSAFSSRLSMEKRSALERCLREKLMGMAVGNGFTLIARAWVVKGSVPARSIRA